MVWSLYLPVHTCHRSACHLVGHTSAEVEVITQEVLEATVTELEHLI